MDFDDDDDEEKKTTKGPKFPIQMYISEGNKYFRQRKFDLAIEFFNKGLEKEPSNEKCLIGRSKCYMRLAKYSEAKEDAETVLKTHKSSCDARMLIGEADYFLGDFEKAFLTFYEGHKFRSNHNKLRCGHQMCKKAIDNSLKPDTPIVIDDEDVEDIYKLKESPSVDQTSKSKISQNQYLEDMNFVNFLLQNDTIEVAHPDCEYIKEYLTDRQIFWRTQNPKTSKRFEVNSAVNEVVEKLKSSIQVLDIVDEGVETKPGDNIIATDFIEGEMEEKPKEDSHTSEFVEGKVKDNSHTSGFLEENATNNSHKSKFAENKPKDKNHVSDSVKEKVEGQPKDNNHISDSIKNKDI